MLTHFIFFIFSSSDDVLTLAIDGNTLFAHHLRNPIAIKYFGFATLNNAGVQFYYNCTSNINDDHPMDSVTSQANNQDADLVVIYLVALTTVLALITFRLNINCTPL